MGAIKIEDGLESLQRHLNIKDAAALIEKTAVWVTLVRVFTLRLSIGR